MKADNFNLKQYFDRIAYSAVINPSKQKITIAHVSEMMRRQLFAVPFENTEVQAGFIPSLLPERIFAKIVTQKRGGYCYEVNGLFAMALEAMNIHYFFVAARPMFYPTRRPKTHLAIVAELDGAQWLCDLGFGSYGIRAPLPIHQLDTEIQQDYDTFQLVQTSGREYCLQARIDGAWAKQYSFDIYPQEWIDFAPANYMNATHPDAIFVQKLLIVQHNPQGRTILFGRSLKKIINGISDSKIIAVDALESVILKEFGLQMPYPT